MVKLSIYKEIVYIKGAGPTLTLRKLRPCAPPFVSLCFSYHGHIANRVGWPSANKLNFFLHFALHV